MSVKQARGARKSVASGDASQDWTERYLAALGNHGKRGVVPGSKGLPVRSHGLVVVTRRPVTLQQVQDVTLGSTWNDSLTARYRLSGGLSVATLFAAFLEDVRRLQAPNAAADQSATDGDVRFDPSRHWGTALQNGFLRKSFDDRRSPGWAPAGVLDPGWLETFFAELADESFVPTGARVVLFCEKSSTDARSDGAAWMEAEAEVFDRLPERVGIVVAGLDVEVNPEDPHRLELEIDAPGLSDATERVTAYEYVAAPFRSDRPATEDRLGSGPYATALARFVLHPDTAPLTIGIHGRWGKGKSSFMRFVDDALIAAAASSRPGGEARLEEVRRVDAEKAKLDDPLAVSSTSGSASERAARREVLSARRSKIREELRRLALPSVVTVEFNAWRFEDSTQIWAGLASEITRALEGALPRRRRLLTPLADALRTRRLELLFDVVLPLLVATMVIALAIAGTGHLQNWIQDQVGSSAVGKLLGGVIPVGGTILLGLWIVGSRAQRVIQPVSERVLTYLRRPDYRDRMGFQHVVLDDIHFVQKRLRKARPNCRGVVFIDDLDRCSDDKIMQVLQAINLILAESDFYIFLGIDTEMIFRAIRNHYSKKKAPVAESFPESYLRKIVQLQFHLPPSTHTAREEFLRGLFSSSARPVPSVDAGAVEPPAASSANGLLTWDRRAIVPLVEYQFEPVEDTPEELAAFGDFQIFVVDNPRELKRLVNVHRLVKILIQPTGLSPTPESQRKLVKWLVFCAGWPDLVDDVLAVAAENPAVPDCITAAVEQLALRPEEKNWLGTFAQTAEEKDVLSADDLSKPDWLVRAAQISQLIASEPAPRAML